MRLDSRILQGSASIAPGNRTLFPPGNRAGFSVIMREDMVPCLTCGGIYGIKNHILLEDETMERKHIVSLKTRNLCASAANGGCGECQTSCQSACKTSCGIANQKGENSKKAE